MLFALPLLAQQPVSISNQPTVTARAVGNAGGVVDATGQNATAPANWLSMGCDFFTSPTTITNGNGSNLECDNAGNLLVDVKTTVTVSGTVSTTPPSNASTNVAQVGSASVATASSGQQNVAPGATASSNVAVSECNILTAASTNSTSCKGSAGNFYGYEIFNTTTTVYYLRLYNASSAPTCSSSTGFIRSIPIPPAAASGQVGGIVSNQNFPANYGTGIGYCITGGSGSTDNTNAAAGIFGEIRYD